MLAKVATVFHGYISSVLDKKFYSKDIKTENSKICVVMIEIL